MSRKAFIHVNGISYQLLQPIEDEQDVDFMELDERVRKLASPKGDHFYVPVLIDGVPTSLNLTSAGVFATAVYLEAAPTP